MNTEDKEGRKRLIKIMKTCRKYLTHVQKSVFEGDITEGKLSLLKNEIENIVDKDKDFVIIYSTRTSSLLARDIITNTHDPTDNFI
jgi:CRISPR-associated protein Cas2